MPSRGGGSNYTKVGARYYDAEWGRFITRDTELSQSPYAYCNGDPVNCTDPTGHDTTDPTPDDIKKLIEEAEKALAAFGLGSGSGTRFSDPQPVPGATADPGNAVNPGASVGADIGRTNVGLGNLNGPGAANVTASASANAGNVSVNVGVTGAQGAGAAYNAGGQYNFGNYYVGYQSGGLFTFGYKFP